MEISRTELPAKNAELHAGFEKATHQREKKRLMQGSDAVLDAYAALSAELAETRAALQSERAERQRIEEALHRSEYRFRSLFNQMSEGFALCEVVFNHEHVPGDLRLLEINPAIEQLSGLKRSDLIGKTMRQLLPNSHLGWIQSCGRVALEGTSVHLECHSDALNRYFEIFACGATSGTVVCLFRDITHRKRSETALSEHQERLQLAIDITEMGTFEYEPPSGRLIWSELTRRHFALPPEAHVDKNTFVRSIHPEDRPRIKQALTDAFHPENGGRFAGDCRVLSLVDGEERWISARGRVFFDAQGCPLRFLGVVIDITQRKKMEKERQEMLSEFQRQRSLLSAIINQMPLGVMVSDASGRVLLANEALSRIFGANVDYERGMDCHAQLNAVDNKGAHLDPHDWPLARTLRSQEIILDEQISIRQPDELPRVLSVSSTPVLNQRGEILAGVALFSDISERVAMQEVVRESHDQLERQVAQRTIELIRAEERERHRLAQVLHDDLQQSLVGARMKLSCLLQTSPPKALQNHLWNLDQLLGECLATTHSLTGELSPRVLFEADLGDTLKWLAKRFRKKHGLKIRVSIDKTASIKSEDLRIALFQAVRELLFNTVKHAKVDRACVRLSRLKDGQIRIVVSDKGAGFDPAQAQAKESADGGFGLFNLRERISLFGGLEVQSAPGCGSRFTLTVRE